MNAAVTFQALHSLRTKILLAVIACAVLPLTAVGTWLTASAARSGELLLRSQLDSSIDRAVVGARERWSYRRSDVLLLARNAPIRRALSDPVIAASPPAFLELAFATTSDITGLIVRGADGRAIWTMGNVPARRIGADAVRNTEPDGDEGPTDIAIAVPIAQDGNPSLGSVVALVRLEALLPSINVTQSGGPQFIAVHDRTGGGWFHPSNLPTSLIESQRFDWQGHHWIAVRRALDDPSIDVFAVGQLDPFVRPFAHTATAGAAALTVVSFLVIAAMLVVAGRLTASLRLLSDAADAVSAGQLETHVNVSTSDEAGRVARAFNAMTESVRQMMRERSQREAVTAMGELAATLAHQVRSPATAIRLDVQRAHDKLSPDAPSRALLARALTQLDRLERAIAGALRLARAGGATFERIDVRDPLRRALEGVERVETSGIAAAPLPVHGDAPSLEQLFGNVLTNAVQATENGSPIHVTADWDPSGPVVITIRDEGAGMTPDACDRAGEPLFSTKPEGTGLGLAIAKRIAAAHGGSIRWASAPGSGTTVSIELPASPSP